MWISYADSEVNKFHPICERALNYALKLKNKDYKYRVIHHQNTGSLEMDFVIQNKNTGKYLCVVEVKRTPSDVHSARYQFQAMSYVQMNAGQNEKTFYILTNLEYAFSFRYDSNRPKVFQQMLKPGLTHVGDFDSYTENDFIIKLGEFFAEQIEQFTNDQYDYLVTLEEFAAHMESIRSDNKKWKTHLAILLYEYIRGSFNAVKRNDLKDIRLFRKDVKRICDEAVRVNFKDIFTYSNSEFENTFTIDNAILSDIYDFGEQNINGNSLAGILHSIVSFGHEHEGEVPTDLELARLVAILAKNSSGELLNSELICDPAAGSGNLINEVIPEYNLNPQQIMVNDINSKLLELLSMRIGLDYPQTISVRNTAQIYNYDIADMDQAKFNDVKVLVMNPPYCAGINSISRKNKIYTGIKKITGNIPQTQVGQMPLEAVFLEMTLALIKPGTTVACVFPKTHLNARGQEAKIIRKILINEFGLHTVFTYPGDDIFDNVVKDTCVLVGIAHTTINEIKVLSSYNRIPDIDIHKFKEKLSTALTNDFKQMIPGIVAKKIDRNIMVNTLNDGWRFLNSEMTDAIMFVEDKIKQNVKLMLLGDSEIIIKRGMAGNSGGSDLMFINSREDFIQNINHLNINTAIGMRNAILDTIDIGKGDSEFFDIALNDDSTVDSVISIYNTLPTRLGKQQRSHKSDADWKKILKKESRFKFPANSVLIPRGIRTSGRAFLSANPVFVSTNFVVCSMKSYDDAIVLASWISTIFYQLICEVSSKDQEGMRKMKVMDIVKTFIPDKTKINQRTIDKIKSEFSKIEFLELKNPKIRLIDEIWAEEIFGTDAKSALDEAERLLRYLVEKRKP